MKSKPFAKILWALGAYFSFCFYFYIFHDFVSRGAWQPKSGDIPALIAVLIFTAFLMYRFRRPILRFLYYSVVALFYISTAITALSLGSRILDGVESFLTSPIGIKPDAQLGDFGGAFYFFLILTVILGVLYLVAKYFRGFGHEVRDLMANPASAKSASSTKN